MPVIAYGGARASAGLGHVCSRLFNESISESVTFEQGGHITMARLTSSHGKKVQPATIK